MTHLPPGSDGWPLVGETLHFLFDPRFGERRHAKYGDVFRTHILGNPTVWVRGPEAVKKVLSTHMDHFSWREGWPDSFKILLGESMFVQDGEKHQQQRSMLMPAFHGRALASYFETMNTIIVRHLEQWLQQGELRWFEENRRLTFDIACQILLGTIPGEDVAELSHCFDLLTNGLLVVRMSQLPWTTFGKALRARTYIVNYIEKVIEQRRDDPGDDALSMMLAARDESGAPMNHADLINQSLLLLFAGHETTTSMITSLLLELARNPEILARARAEQQELAATGPVSLEQLRQMPYLEQVLREIERVHPPVPSAFRGVVKPVELGGYTIPVGWRVLYSILSTHRIEHIYPNSDHFDPDRFLPGQEQHKQQSFSLIGFGGGPRFCLGMAFALMEIKMIAAHLLRDYTWDLLPGQDLTMQRIPTRRPKDGLQVFLRRWHPALNHDQSVVV